MTLDTIDSNELRWELEHHPIVVIAHAPCPDGMTSSVVMRCFLSSILKDCTDKPFMVEYVEGRHASKLQDLPNVKDAVVFVLDFSYPKETLLQMERDAKRLIVLDHHKSAQKDLAGLPFCEFDMNRCGARMTYDFMAKHFELDEEYSQLNRFVNYIQDRDLWIKELPHNQAIADYVGTLPLDLHRPEAWLLIAQGATRFEDMVSKGKTIRRVIEKQVDDCIDRSYTGHLMGRTEHVPVVNVSPNLASEVLNKLVVMTESPYAIGWWYDGARYHYSLRANGGADCSEIARRYAGGGHANAAGFTTMDDMTVTWAKDAHENRKARMKLYGDN